MAHVLFWAVCYASMFETYGRRGVGSWAIFPYMANGLIAFYFLAYYTIPRYVLKGNYGMAALHFVGVYTFFCFIHRAHYYFYLIIDPDGAMVPLRHAAALRYMEIPFWKIYAEWGLRWDLLNFLWLIIPAVSIKFTKLLWSEIRKKVMLERRHLELQRDFLKAQVSPHFLFNTLNNIHRMVSKADVETWATIQHLKELMQYTAFDAAEHVVALKKEIGFLQDYIGLERIRYGDEVVLKQTWPAHHELADKEIVPLLLLPFVENAFKHGPASTIERSWVSIALRIQDGHTLVAEISTSYSRETGATSEKDASGIGIVNVRERLALHYPDRHSLAVDWGINSFSVRLSIKL